MQSVALLRGINVGGNKKVEMKKLKKAFEDVGFTDVRTYINSGNVIFSHKKSSEEMLAKNISKILKETFGFPIDLILISSKTLVDIASHINESWINNNDQKTDVIFLAKNYQDKSTLKKIITNSDVDTLVYRNGAIIWNVSRKHYTKSGMHKFIGTEIYKNMTARNCNTVRKLASLLKQ